MRRRAFIAAGFAVLIGLSGLFVTPEALAPMPLWVRLLVQQPVISGGLTLVVLYAVLCAEPAPAKRAAVETREPKAAK